MHTYVYVCCFAPCTSTGRRSKARLVRRKLRDALSLKRVHMYAAVSERRCSSVPDNKAVTLSRLTNKPLCFLAFALFSSVSGTQDFTGPRYHCLQCPDYDLCQHCHDTGEPVPQHRYPLTDGHWKREGGFHEHTDLHDVEEIWPMHAQGLPLARAASLTGRIVQIVPRRRSGYHLFKYVQST